MVVAGRRHGSVVPTQVTDAAGKQTAVYDFKLYELRHTAASLAIQAGANIKALQNMLGHESAGLTLDRYGHLYGSDVEAVGVAINALLTRDCGQNVVNATDSALPSWAFNSADLRFCVVEPRGIEPLTPALQKRIMLLVKGLRPSRSAETYNCG